MVKSNFPLERLGTELATKVVEKIPFEAPSQSNKPSYPFISFCLCSKSNYDLCNNLKAKIQFPAMYFNMEEDVNSYNLWLHPASESELRQVEWNLVKKHNFAFKINGFMVDHLKTKEQYKELMDSLCDVTIEFDFMRLYHAIIDPVDLMAIVEKFKIKNLDWIQIEGTTFEDISAQLIAQQIKKMTILSTAISLKEDSLLQLMASEMCFSQCVIGDITSETLNKLLRQWKDGIRTIKKIDIAFNSGILDPSVIVDGLSANPIWTPELHSHSIIGHIPFEETERYLRPHFSYFSLFNSNDIKNILFVLISKCEFSVYSVDLDNEKEMIFFDEKF